MHPLICLFVLPGTSSSPTRPQQLCESERGPEECRAAADWIIQSNMTHFHSTHQGGNQTALFVLGKYTCSTKGRSLETVPSDSHHTAMRLLTFYFKKIHYKDYEGIVTRNTSRLSPVFRHQQSLKVPKNKSWHVQFSPITCMTSATFRRQSISSQ